MTNTNIYQNITARTGGDIYLGVVGPVRTGKSTFIKRFMDVMVLPQMEDSAAKKRTVDELPQSAQGKTIMTTEPKFIPREAVSLQLEDDVTAKVKLIDCVGYLIDGVTATGRGNERMVKTPWFDHEIPFAKAAQIGTGKVIREACHPWDPGDHGREFYRYSKRKLCSGRRTDGSGVEKNRKTFCGLAKHTETPQ